MAYAVGYDENWERDVGYAVPATCDHPDCATEIHRGVSRVCGNGLFGGDTGCGLYFCRQCKIIDLCERCEAGEEPFEKKPDLAEWLKWKLTHKSWATWRDENPAEVEQIKKQLKG